MDVEVCVPDIGVDHVEVIEVLVKIGDTIKKEDSLVSVEGHKSVLEIPSPVSGIVKKIFVKVGDILSVNKLILIVDENEIIASQKEVLENNFFSKSLHDSDNKYINYDKKSIFDGKKIQNNYYASPNIRRIARILNINLLSISGSGSKGRITKEDINRYIKLNKNTNTQKKIVSTSEKDNISMIKNIHEYKELTNIQKISGKNLLNNWKNIPHVTQFDEADITDLENFRNLYNSKQSTDKNYCKISLLSFLVKAAIATLLKYPRFNSILDTSKKGIILKKDINIGIAVETSEGLLVPVLKNLIHKNIMAISSDIQTIVNRAKKNTLSSLDMSNGSFTISSLGGIGGTGFTPIINSPESSILGVSRASIKPIWNKKKFSPRLILPFSLSYDHRIIDGADGVRFTTFFSQLLSDIRNLLI
ncbi:2-oxo acid dehydrogenase subunit E2 [Buchnera aphidicola]|uniref:Dihydrolipoamide acetyltransferase component of pyruvate dehydrogenase complex n=1 Tax=Buchnera aphidicola (Cinara strobi) TaxID=1921549 RepID=A0A3B1E7S9_9GAMM|nr:2-oxo acid dehydrogenase subunit E2 [Buchnera aphidicola]VAX76437.1 Dihydrolipoyllysine-residue acetyltransferase component of pyruvate dehydrogenase complex [Buchnera aphidicola (Cinara strobi)]